LPTALKAPVKEVKELIVKNNAGLSAALFKNSNYNKFLAADARVKTAYYTQKQRSFFNIGTTLQGRARFNYKIEMLKGVAQVAAAIVLIFVFCTSKTALAAPAAQTPEAAISDTDNQTDVSYHGADSDENTSENTTNSSERAGTINSLVKTLFGESAETIDIIILLTVLTLLPSIIIMMTGFTRIIIVLSFLRNALSMQNAPPNQVMIGLALFITLFVMSPIVSNVYENAYLPYSREEISQSEFFDRAMTPTREFMLKQTYNSDLTFFIGLSREPVDNITIENVPNRILIPAFITSEIKHAFQIGFFIYIPFIVIDMVVASTLMAMGMMMLPPAMISLPFKILLFVFVDGWQLVIGSVVKSFA